MKRTLPILGIILAGTLALGAGCAVDEDLLGGGKTNPTEKPDKTPTPTPSGSGMTGGIK